MATIIESGIEATAAAGGAAARHNAFALSVHRTLEAAAPAWRRLEAAGAILTPYQRYDWIAGWQAAADDPGDLAIVVVEHEGKPVALLPLALHRRFGLTRATIPGSDVGNADWMIVLPEFAAQLGRVELVSLLAAAGRQVGGIDLVALFNLPPAWGGTTNPLLALPHRPGPNRLYRGARNAEGSFDRLDDKRRGNLLQRRRKLARIAGEVELKTATTPAEVESFLQIFLAQRAVRFAQMGIPNVFAEPRFVNFFRDGAVAALGTERPALVIQTLYAGERAVASAIGAIAGAHYSQYINATSADADITRYRLIGLLMHAVVSDMAARGCTSIDMGLGDFDYKTDWTEPQEVFDSTVALTVRGRGAALVLLALRRLKRTLKQNASLLGVARRARALLWGGKRREEDAG